MTGPDDVEFKSVSDDPWRWSYRTSQYRKREGVFKKPYALVGSYGEYELLASDQGGGFYDMIATTKDDEVVGSIFFGPWDGRDTSHIEGAVEVDPRYRRKGIASAMYVAAEQLSGKKLRPAKSHTPLAEALWKSRSRSFGDGDPASKNPSEGHVVSDEDEPQVCDRCGEEQPPSEDGKCDNCDGMICDGCGERSVLNENMMCAECEPPESECLECGAVAVLRPDHDPHVGLCEFCAERAEIGEVCENCQGEGELDDDGLCEQCSREKKRGKVDGTPRWLRDILAERKKKIAEAVKSAVPGGTVDWKKQFGCGHYGCAYAVRERGHPEPRYVVKVTRDPTEGPMQATIARRQKAGEHGFDDGFAIVRGVYRIGDDVQHMGKTWPVYAVVREEVTPVGVIQNMDRPYRLGRDDKVGGIHPSVTSSQLSLVMSSLGNYKDLAAKWYAEKAKKKPLQRNLDRIEDPMNNALNAISAYAPPLGQVMSILQSEGTPLRDVHGNNVGVRHHEGIVDPEDPKNGIGYIVIFDPGHMAHSDEAVERGIARMNPETVELECGHWDVRDAARPDQCSACSGQRTTGKLPSTLVKGGPFEVTLGGTFGGTTLFVSKDPKSREWRVTRFVGGKPRGHFVVGLWEDAVAEVEQRYWTEDLSGAKSSGWSHNPPGDDFTYSFPDEHLSAAANPAKAEQGFHDAFGIPYEAHLAPVWPKERKKYVSKVKSPKELAEYLAAVGDIPQEQFMVALLDQRGGLMGVVLVSKGTLNAAEVHPREVFAAAIAARAVGIIGVHNHPSGDITPSDADVDLSGRLADVGAIVGIPLYDHIVLGRNGEYTSMAQVGMLPKATRRHQNNPRREWTSDLVDLDARPTSPNPNVDGFDFADDFGQSAEPEAPGRFHLDTLKRGDVVRVGKTKWHVFSSKHGAWVVKYGTSGKKMYQIHLGDSAGRRFAVSQMTGGGDLIGDPVAEGDAEVVGWEEKA